MSIITDEVYNSLKWELATMDQLKAIMHGAVVLEAEAIDEPRIDGVDLIIKCTDGRLRVVSFNAELEEIEDNPLYIAIATIPEEV